jgi:hypothetical protein
MERPKRSFLSVRTGEQIVSHSEAPISITVKTAAGSLVTVRAEHGDQLDLLLVNGLEAIKSATTELESAIRGAAPVATPMTATAIASSLGASIISTDNSTASLGGRNCPHGKMTAIQGTGKDGSLYRGYFCPAPKGAFDKCKNVYLKTTDAAWNTFVPEQVK